MERKLNICKIIPSKDTGKGKRNGKGKQHGKNGKKGCHDMEEHQDKQGTHTGQEYTEWTDTSWDHAGNWTDTDWWSTDLA